MHKVIGDLYRGSRPEHIKFFVQQGVKTVISLQSGAEDNLTESDYEIQSAVGDLYGIDVVKIPCSNIFPPDVWEVRRAHLRIQLGLLKGPVYVHCHSGVDRTGFIIESYLMRYHGKSFEDACRDWVKEGRHWWFFWWESALKKWAKHG